MALILTFQNITSCAPVSDYAVNVLVGDGTVEGSRVLYRGNIRAHERSLGWQALVQRLLAENP